MAKLTEAHIEQIRNMREDGKKGTEIIDFFRNTYKIKIDRSEISRIQHNKYNLRKDGGSEARSKPHIAKKIKIPVSEDEVKNLIRQAFEIYKKKFIQEVMDIISKEEL